MDGSQDTRSKHRSDDSDQEMPNRAVAAYWAGEATDEEDRIAQAWLAKHADAAVMLRKAWDLSADHGEPADIEWAWRNFLNRQRIGSGPADQGSAWLRKPTLPRTGLKAYPFGGEGVKAHSLRREVWRITTALALAAVVVLSSWNVFLKTRKPVSKAMLAYMTGPGQRANILLPDGSTVFLNVASRLDVPADYLSGDHMVRLTGEGLFTVTHHSQRPFVVMAGGVRTQVLGTSFAVRRYPSDRTTLVAVRDGKVAVRSLILTSNEQVEIGAATTGVVRPVGGSAFSFAAAVLTLKSESLADAIPELNRWYDADIRLGDPALATLQIQGRIAAGSLSELASMLAWTFNVRVVRDGRVLTLFPK